MSTLFWTLNHEETLQQIHNRLSQGAAPARILAELLPRTKQSALTWGRSLAAWEEFRLGYPPQAIALARLISQRAMREFHLMLREDGRVVDRPAEGARWKPQPPVSFSLTIGGEEVRVEYTAQYFPNSAIGMVYFRSPHEPAKPHALSDSGHLSRFVSPDTVEACGGPQQYAALLADAILGGKEKEFTEALEGASFELKRHPRQTQHRQATQPGGYAEEMEAEEKLTQPPSWQGMLF